MCIEDITTSFTETNDVTFLWLLLSNIFRLCQSSCSLCKSGKWNYEWATWKQCYFMLCNLSSSYLFLPLLERRFAAVSSANSEKHLDQQATSIGSAELYYTLYISVIHSQTLKNWHKFDPHHQVESWPTQSLPLSASWSFSRGLSSPCWWGPTFVPWLPVTRTPWKRNRQHWCVQSLRRLTILVFMRRSCSFSCLQILFCGSRDHRD